jgi:predicted phosphodiesterase
MSKVMQAAREAANEKDAEIARLNKLVESQQQRIDDMGKKRFKLQPVSPKKSGKGSFTRVIIPDSHGSHADPEALGALLGDLQILGPSTREVVWLGDHLDCGGFLAQHHTLGFVAETESGYQDDIDAANDLLDRVQALTPSAAHHYIEGNHEHRVEKWAITQAVSKSKDVDYLLRIHGFQSVLHLAQRNFSVYLRGQKYHDLDESGIIKLGHCYFMHGASTAKHAAAAMVSKFAGNVVYGHTHRADEYTAKLVHVGIVKAWCPGCLCKISPLWMDTNITNWSHGYALQLVQADGSFLHITVPIIKGVSYLKPLMERLAMA